MAAALSKYSRRDLVECVDCFGIADKEFQIGIHLEKIIMRGLPVGISVRAVVPRNDCVGRCAAHIKPYVRDPEIPDSQFVERIPHDVLHEIPVVNPEALELLHCSRLDLDCRFASNGKVRPSISLANDSLDFPTCLLAEKPMRTTYYFLYMQTGKNGEDAPRLLYQRIAERLANDLDRHGDPELPPTRVLCSKYGVSPVTMSKAVHLLSERGILEVAQGRRILLKMAGSDRREEGKRSGGSARRLFHRIKSDIADGTLKRGQYLPKIAYYILSQKVTDNTVCEAYRMLEEKGLAHKSGKYWIVGPSESAQAAASGKLSAISTRPTIIVLVPHIEQWLLFFQHDHTQKFVWEFVSELDRYGVDYQICAAREDPSYSIATGKQEIRERIAALGRRYQGALITCTLQQVAESGLADWIEWFAGFKKPVLWLDYADEGAEIDRRKVPIESYYHLRGSDHVLVSLALDALHGLGHRNIAVFENAMYREEPWQARRIKTILEVAQRYRPRFNVTVLQQNEPFWEKRGADDRGGMRKFPQPEADTGEAMPATLSRNTFLKSVPSLGKLVAESEATALVALNDWFAANYAVWFEQAGVSIPKDLSIISFDNAPSFAHHPITTIDLGLSFLGYYGAHIFIGDLPVKADRWGNIISKPVLMHRGSLGPPRRHKLHG